MTTPYTAEELVRKAVAAARPSNARHPRWVVVRDLFCVGSTTAYEICAACKLDPDEILKP